MKAYRFDIVLVANEITGETKVRALLDYLAEHPSCIVAFDYKEVELKERLPGIFDNQAYLKELVKEKAAFFFIGPEEKLYITPDFLRLPIKEVIKNKEVTVYKINPLP